MKNSSRLVGLFAGLWCLAAAAEPDTFGLGDGHDGAQVVAGANTVINVYAQLTAPTAPGDTTLTVSAVAGFAAADLVMVYQSTGVVPIPVSGTPSPFDISSAAVARWELVRLKSAAGTTLTLTAPLVGSFAASVTQVLKVPEYTTVTVNAAGSIVAPAWNGVTGGVVAFLATGAVTNNGLISVSNGGFRPGSVFRDAAEDNGCVEIDGANNSGKWANKGEGIANTRFGAGNNARGNVADGAGGGDCNGSGGGGGGNGGQGGQGGQDTANAVVGGMGGSALTYSLYDHFTFGGGGGAGQMDDLVATAATGAGGGAVWMRGGSLAGTGFIHADGQAGTLLTLDGSGGGGAGGSLYLRFSGAVTCGGITANGGNGANADSGGAPAAGPGGGGGGGQVLIQGTSIAAACNPAVNSGVAGTLGCCGGGNHGATPPASTSNGIVVTPPGGFTVPPVAVLTVPANGAFTGATPTISGTETLNGSTIEAFVDTGTTPVCTATVSGAAWSCTSSALSAGAHTVFAVATYQGTQSLPSNVNSFTVRTAAPAPPTILIPLAGSTVNTPTPTLSGTAEPGSTVAVSEGPTPLCTAAADPVTGAWSCVSSALLDGSHTATAMATNVIGTSGPSVPDQFYVRTKAPIAPAIAAPISGSNVYTATPTVQGTGEPGDSLTVFEGARLLCSTTVSAAGTWSCVSAALADGSHVITATAGNGVGTATSPSDSFFVRTQPPAAPSITSPSNGSNVYTATPTLSGLAEPNSTVTVTELGAALCTATTSVAGNWSCISTVSLADGSHTVLATAANTVGSGPPSAPDQFWVRTVPPAAPAILSPVNGSTVNSATPAISGTGEPNALISVSENAVVLCNATAGAASGAWSCVPVSNLADGSHTVTATATNALGTSLPSLPDQFWVRTSPPAAPVILRPANASVVNSSTPSISGTAEQNALVTVTEASTTLCTATASATTGAWACTSSALVDGSHTVVATATNALGTSPSSAPDQFWVRTQLPAAPVITAPANGATVNTPQPLISGSAEPGSTVTVTNSTGAVLCTAVADPVTGAWSCSPTVPLADGSYTISATATNGVGTGPASSPVTFTVKTAPPGVPVIVSPASGSYIATRTPVIFGTDQRGATVTLVVDGTALATVPVDSAGNWAYALTAAQSLADGAHTATATATDIAGNVSQPSAPDTFHVEATPPAAPVITSPTQGAVTGGAPPITGTAPPGSLVTVYVDGVVVGTVTADASGNWTLQLVGNLANGPHTVDATATNQAGLTGPPSTTIDFTVSTSAAASPVILSPVDGSTIGTRTPTIIGTAPAGSSVHLTVDTAAIDTPADVNGNWAYTLSAPQALADGPHTASATDTDALGRTSQPSNTVHFTVLATAPNAPVIVAPPNGSTITTATPIVIGSAPPNLLVTLTIDGVVLGFTPADAQGNWAVALTGGLANGPHTATATATDAAGNVSAPSAADTFTVNVTGGVAAPVITSPIDGSSINTATPTIAGSAPTSSTVTVLIDGVSLGTAAADAAGAWAFPVPLAQALSAGLHVATATATVGAVTSGSSNTVSFTVLLSTPAAPVVVIPANGTVIFTATPTIAGTAPAGDTVHVSVDANLLGTTSADIGGHWAYPIPTSQMLADGAHAATATASDAAGNASAVSNSDAFTVETQVPAPPIILTPPNNSVVSTNPPAITGSAEPLSTVGVSVDAVHVCTVTASASGTWACTPPSPDAPGAHTIQATATNPIGTSAPATSTFIVPGGPDAGTGDGGVNAGDGGTDSGIASDAGLPDAGSGTDAGGADAGAPPDLSYKGGGCSCEATGSNAFAVGLALLALMRAAALRRQRQL